MDDIAHAALRASLDAWEASLADALPPEKKPHAAAIVCKDGTVASFVGPHAFVLAALFAGTIAGEDLIP